MTSHFAALVSSGVLLAATVPPVSLPSLQPYGSPLFPAFSVTTRQTAAPAAPLQERPFVPQVGQEGKDVVWVPTSPELVQAMLDLAGVTSRDFVMDLGSGDGRNVIAAARRGARGLGVEFNPDMVALSQQAARDAGVAELAQFVQGDMYQADISRATVLALFLLPHNLEQLKDKFLAMPPGTRIVMNTFTLTGWEADETVRLENGCSSWCTALLHIVPAKVGGTWQFDGGQLVIEQEFQKVSGTLTRAGAAPVAVSGSLRAALLTLTVGDRTYVGRVQGDRMAGTAVDVAGGPVNWTASR